MPQKPTNEDRVKKIQPLEEKKDDRVRDLSMEARDFGPTKLGAVDNQRDLLEEIDSLESIINVEKLQSIMDDFHKLTGMVTAILDMKGNIIESTGWQDICTKFHRIHPETAQNCTESDLFLVNNIKPGEYVEYKCKNGLWDVVTPLYIGNRHMGNIYTGQFFYDDDSVDEKRFIQQAETYGFDKTAYLDALHRVPSYSREEIKHLMQFLVKFASYISNVSYAKSTLEIEIRDRKQAEEALADQKKRLDYILQGTNVGTWEWNVQTGETIFNERWADIIGYTLEEISPVSIETWIKFCHPGDMKETNRLLKLCFNRASEYYHCECRMKHKDGSWVWVLDRGKIATWTENGRPEWMFGTHQDITERKRAEEEREKLQAQLTQAQKMESVGRLAGGVAHDFNNMLGVILGHAELAMDRINMSEALRVNLKEIQKAAERSASLTRQLLAFARKETVSPKILDLNKTVESLIKMLKRLIGENIDLAWLPGKNLAPVKIDPSQIDQILANLCVNARDAIIGVGKVTIETEMAKFDETYCQTHLDFLPGEYVLLAVSDNGCGMDAETLSNIFEPFFTTKEQGKGTGLGLATVYGIVKQNNGFINVYSEPGQGTTFKIYLPWHLARTAPQPESTPIPNVAPFNETILLVEDEPAILRMTTMMLDREGYNVMAAASPKEAIELAHVHPGEIQLLMTDVVMPEMNGRDLAKNISSLYPNIKCLFMSGYTANVIAHHGVLDERVNFIQKPFTKKNLCAKVREVLEGMKIQA